MSLSLCAAAPVTAASYGPAMRRVLAFVLVVLALPATASAAESWGTAIKDARAYANTRSGTITFAVTDELGRLHGSRDHAHWYSASLLKPIIMGTLMTRPSVRIRPLSSEERALLTPMIRESANGPADTLFTQLGPRAIQTFGRRHGLASLRVAAPIWGSSIITAAGYARFFRELPRAIPVRHRAFALKLLRTIIKPQRWGVPPVKPRGWSLIFKGGWRAGRGYGRIVNQAALLECGIREVTLTILTDHDPSHVYGTRTVEGVARRLLRPLGRCGGQ
ncbi:MAG: hypothetical protein JWM71_1038 [Solirubrobacteraceae bacterium]|nr:hypothetical protein [Solirubrobacteraceae bacterium]